MRGPRPVLIAIALGLAFTSAACGSDKKSETGSSTSTTAPEDLRASPADVAAGLTAIDATAKGIAAYAGTDKKQAQDLSDQIEPVWARIEGTVKANSADTYITFEDNFAVLEKAAKDGDAAKAQEGSAAVSKAVAEYTAKFPG